MHFSNHQEYLKFFRQMPVEPHEFTETADYVVEADVEHGEEGGADGEVLQAD